MLPVPDRSVLVTFTGRPLGTFNDFVDEALAQATLMFSVVTGLKTMPDDPDLAQLAINAILEMADRVLLEQPYAMIKARPYQSESIGSWSYSRTTATTAKVQSGQRTGLFWWDLAIDELTVPGTSVIGSGSIKADVGGIKMNSAGDTWTIVDPAHDEGEWPPYVRIS